MKAEFEGTKLALTEQKRPNCTILLDNLSAFTMGQLFYLFELQTAYGGKFYNVNAFDQPGVEAGKINAFAMFGKKGFEQRKNEIELLFQKTQKNTTFSILHVACTLKLAAGRRCQFYYQLPATAVWVRPCGSGGFLAICAANWFYRAA